MNNLLKIAHHLPVKTEAPVISVSPVVLAAPDRGMDLEMRISAPVTGENLPVILLSHGHGPSLYLHLRMGMDLSSIFGRRRALSLFNQRILTPRRAA